MGAGKFEVIGGACLIDLGLDRWRLRNFVCSGCGCWSCWF